MKIDLQKKILPAIIVAAAVMIVNYVLSLIKYPQAGLFSSIQATSVITGTIGEKVLALIGGIIPITSSITGIALIVIAISAYIILLAGDFLIEQFNLPTLRTPKIGRLVSTILWGALPFYILVVGTVVKLFSLPLIIGLALHTLAVAYLAAYIAGFMNVQVN